MHTPVATSISSALRSINCCLNVVCACCHFFFFQAEDGIRDLTVTGVQTCALPISAGGVRFAAGALSKRRRDANLLGYRPSDGKQWQKQLGSFSLCLFEVPTAELSRVGRPFHHPIAMGARLLREIGRAHV